MSLAAKAAWDICLSSQPVFFANSGEGHLIVLETGIFRK
jgi:hypothetical protein